MPDSSIPPFALVPAERRYLVIYNPMAGWLRGRQIKAIVTALRASGVAVDLIATTGPGDAERLARTAEAGQTALIAAGGDGTINEVINGLMARPAPLPLGILPFGTANVLARELALPLDVMAAARVLVDGGCGAIRLGQANGRFFTMMVGAGFDAHVVARLNPRLKRAIGRYAYAVEGLRELVVGRNARYRVTIDGATVETSSVIVANGHFYGGEFVLAPQARLSDPYLHVCLFRRSGRWATLQYLMATGLDRLSTLADYCVIAAGRVRIEGTDGEPVQGDGEIVSRLPVDVTLNAALLPVLVPAGGGGTCYLPATVMPSTRSVGASTP